MIYSYNPEVYIVSKHSEFRDASLEGYIKHEGSVIITKCVYLDKLRGEVFNTWGYRFTSDESD